MGALMAATRIDTAHLPATRSMIWTMGQASACASDFGASRCSLIAVLLSSRPVARLSGGALHCRGAGGLTWKGTPMTPPAHGSAFLRILRLEHIMASGTNRSP